MINIEAIAALGFDVYQNADERWRTYAYFTDGKRIGYAEQSRFGSVRLCTVHIPNTSTGTGFNISDAADITRYEFEKAFCYAPYWAEGRASTVRKYPTLEAFLKSHKPPLVLTAKGLPA